MGDIRFKDAYERLRKEPNRVVAVRAMSDEDVIAALAAASREQDPLFANFLATEAMNRAQRGRRVIDNVAEGVLALDREGRIQLVNPAAERAFGRLADEIMGEPVAEVVRAPQVPPARHPFLAPLRSRASVVGKSASFTLRDGTPLVASFTAAPLLVEGDVTGVIVTFRIEMVQERLSTEASQAAG